MPSRRLQPFYTYYQLDSFPDLDYWSAVGDGGTGKTTFVKVKFNGLLCESKGDRVLISSILQRHLTGEFEKKYIGTRRLFS